MSKVDIMHFIRSVEREETKRKPRKMKHPKKPHKTFTLRSHRAPVYDWPKMSGLT